MARLEQQPERVHEARDVVEVQTGRRLIEDQELAARLRWQRGNLGLDVGARFAACEAIVSRLILPACRTC